ncbi:protein-L-isoaspartate(D-aspartate) O-methyltransferase [Solimicrobium silvestre]|uniref:Protein-L-isoaspartate O-methyltransferase n=1 Tax=Solimicrobium silvestre TaxID=2099400 RepID=A0A2S9GU67_9BURK|nr:protein-L-isoaspartate(D-aspartate) O-methyltransferase [Solimicrobium silvestre]PRC91277.1 pimt: protein-L-isoaspartate O-methyltransferase [Solimicrobium silvestre]
MTAKNRKFPLPLSSLENKSSNRAQQSTSSLLSVATPQTATQNVRQHEVRNDEASIKNSLPHNVLQHATSTRGGGSAEVTAEHRNESHHKMVNVPIISDAPRRAMVARLVKQGVRDEVVLAAMGAVPRHQFIESGLSGQAYIDASLPIGHQQTISQPYIVARMIEIMRNGRVLSNVLEIGTGCGYQAAVLAQLSENVYSIERIKLLHELAKKNLRSLRIANLRLHYGDGMHGLPQVAPFDGIILAAAGMQIPTALLQQLAIGGRLIAPVGEKQQVLQLIERTGNADWTRSVLEECYFVPLCSGII